MRDREHGGETRSEAGGGRGGARRLSRTRWPWSRRSSVGGSGGGSLARIDPRWCGISVGALSALAQAQSAARQPRRRMLGRILVVLSSIALLHSAYAAWHGQSSRPPHLTLPSSKARALTLDTRDCSPRGCKSRRDTAREAVRDRGPSRGPTRPPLMPVFSPGCGS